MNAIVADHQIPVSDTGRMAACIPGCATVAGARNERLAGDAYDARGAARVLPCTRIGVDEHPGTARALESGENDRVIWCRQRVWLESLRLQRTCGGEEILRGNQYR